MAEQNLFGFIWNIQVKWLHLVKPLCKNQKGGWISGCIPAFFHSPTPSNNKSLMRKARARKARINLRKLQGTIKRSSNGNCINLSAQIHY